MSSNHIHCIYCSSEENDYAFNNILSPTGIRWISKPHPQYPIEAVINLNGDFLLDGIQIINHESMISSSVNIFVSNDCFSGAVEIDEFNYKHYKKDFNWIYLGYFNFNSNEKSQWSAREFIQIKFKKVQVSYIKFVFSECYPTFRINPGKQISLISLKFTGFSLHRMRIGQNLLELYNDLNRNKMLAINQEKYTEAAFFNTQLQNIRENAELLKNLYSQKNEAMEKEKYLTVDSIAKKIRSIVNRSLYQETSSKPENSDSNKESMFVSSSFHISEVSLVKQTEENNIPETSNIETHSQISETIPEPENSKSELETETQQLLTNQEIESTDFIIEDNMTTTSLEQSNSKIQIQDAMDNKIEENHEEDKTESKQQETEIEEGHVINDNEITKGNLMNEIEEGNLINKVELADDLNEKIVEKPKIVKKKKEIKKSPSQEFDEKMKSLSSHPDAVNPLSEDASNEAGYLISLFGEDTIAPIYSTGWAVKSKGYENLVEKIIELTDTAVQNQALQNMLPIIQGMFSSNLKAVYSVGVDKSINLFDEIKYTNLATFKNVITHCFIHLLLSFSLPKLSNTNAGIHEAALKFTQWVVENDKLCVNELIKFVFKPLPSTNSMILLKAKLKILNRIIEEYEKTVTDKLELDKLMKLILPNIESSNQDVKNAAFELYATSYCYYGTLMEKYIKSKPQRLKNQIYTAIGLPT